MARLAHITHSNWKPGTVCNGSATQQVCNHTASLGHSRCANRHSQAWEMTGIQMGVAVPPNTAWGHRRAYRHACATVWRLALGRGGMQTTHGSVATWLCWHTAREHVSPCHHVLEHGRQANRRPQGRHTASMGDSKCMDTYNFCNAKWKCRAWQVCQQV